METKDSLMSEDIQSQKIELFVSCRNLADLDTFTVTDSFLIIRLAESGKPVRQILKTKVYWNDLNPNYAESVVIDFFFEIKQKLLFEVYHDSNPPKLVGKIESSVGEIFGSATNGLIRSLRNDDQKDQGKIILRCEKVHTQVKKNICLTLVADGLPNLTWWWYFGGTRPFFRIFRKRHNDELLIYESQTGKGTCFRWKEFRLSESRLSQNDGQMKIQVRFYSFSDRGNHAYIGNSFFSVGSLGDLKKFQITQNGEKKGTMNFIQVNRMTLFEFGDFIENGLQLALTTCIDFTASNGHQNSPNSLHYISGYTQSKYEQALSEVLNILLDYDFDKLVPVFGFGAKVRMPRFTSNGKVHHCFPLNGNAANPSIYQKEGVMKAYRDALDCLQFSGPTHFSGLLEESIEQCKKIKKQQTEYMIVFILTDGEIHDRQKVIDQIVQCNNLPISVIIVGLGDGDFSIMQELDDDNSQIVDSHGNPTIRDLVQFVEFKKFKNNSVELAREVLEELPRQVAEYFGLMGIKPSDINNRKALDDIQMQKESIEESSVNPYSSLMEEK